MGGTSFDALFRELYNPAYSVALRVLQNPHAAEDAACEALARAASSWRRIKGIDYQRAWVLRVTMNVAIDMIRRNRTIPMASPQQEGSVPFLADERICLAEALSQLPRRQREVVVLRFLADMTEVQVADQLEISQGAVKQHARRGLASLRLLLGGHPDGPDDEGVQLAV